MGVSIFKVSNGTNIEKGNPNPKNFNILEVREIDSYLIAKINFPDCTNYEGNKIIVFQNMSSKHLYTLKDVDPHFTENNSIIARFRPDELGMKMAVLLCVNSKGL